MTQRETIAAIATAAGAAGVGIVRLSGAGCRAIAATLLGRPPVPRQAPRRAVVIAVAGALVILAAETGGELALGLAAVRIIPSAHADIAGTNPEIHAVEQRALEQGKRQLCAVGLPARQRGVHHFRHHRKILPDRQDPVRK